MDEMDNWCESQGLLFLGDLKLDWKEIYIILSMIP